MDKLTPNVVDGLAQRAGVTTHNVNEGMKDFVLASLPKAQHDTIIKLLSRVHEAAYRRGALDGCMIALQPPDKAERLFNQVFKLWRRCNLDMSPSLIPDESGRHAVLQSLYKMFVGTHWRLENLGLKCPDYSDSEVVPPERAKAWRSTTVPHRRRVLFDTNGKGKILRPVA